MMFKNSETVKNFGKCMYETLHKFNEGHLERLDQTVLSFLLATRFNHLKIFELKESIYYESKELHMHWAHPAK